MYLSSNGKIIYERVKHLDRKDIHSSEWFMTCYLGTAEQGTYMSLFIDHLLELIKERKYKCI